MIKITRKNLSHLLLGSAFFGTGGGLPYEEHKRMFEQSLLVKSPLIIKDISEFADTDYLASTFGVGDPSYPKIKRIDFGSLLKEALGKYEKLTKIKVRGIIPGEIGAEGLAFQASAYLNLPIVDSDLVGGRAAPEIQIEVFTANHISFTPVLGMSVNKKSVAVFGDFAGEEVEDLFRKFFHENGGAGILVGYPIQAKEYKKIGIPKTISAAIRAGSLLEKSNINELLKEFNGKVIAETRIGKINLESKEGFLRGSVSFQNGIKMLVKNENIALYERKQEIVTPPDLIILMDSKVKPIHNANLKSYKNDKITILYIPAHKSIKNRAMKKLWKAVLG